MNASPTLLYLLNIRELQKGGIHGPPMDITHHFDVQIGLCSQARGLEIPSKEPSCIMARAIDSVRSVSFASLQTGQGQAMLESILAGANFALFGTWAGGLMRISAVCRDLAFCGQSIAS